MPTLYDDLLIALHGVWNRRWLALGVAWVVCVIGWLVVSLIPNTYESRARVYVATQSVIQDKAGISPIEQQKNLDALRQTLASATNLERVVRETDLAKTVASEADLAARVAALRERITLVSTPDNIFEITTKMADRSVSDRVNARFAAQVTQKLIDIFQQENANGDRSETQQGLAFLDERILETGKALSEADQKRVTFSMQFADMLPGAGSLADRMNAARMELGQIDNQLMGAQSALAAMNGQLAGTPATVAAGGGAAPSALASAQAELAAARARGWTSQHPDVIALERQVAALKAQGGSAASGGSAPNPAWLSIKSMQAERAATVQGLQARKAQLASGIAAIERMQVSDPGLAAEGERLDRDYNALKTQYDKLLADREAVRLRGDAQRDVKGATFRVVDPPVVPSAPVSPNRALLLIGVLVVGISAGVGTAFGIGQIRQTFPTRDRLEKVTGLPVIGTVTEALTPVHLAEHRQKLRQFAGGCGGLVIACVLLILIEYVQRGLA